MNLEMKPMEANRFCELTEGEMHLWDSFKRRESKFKVVPPVNTELFLRALPCCTVRDAQCSSISQAIPMWTLAAVPKPIQPHRHGKAAAWLELSLLTQHLKSGLNLLLSFSLNIVFLTQLLPTSLSWSCTFLILRISGVSIVEAYGFPFSFLNFSLYLFWKNTMIK